MPRRRRFATAAALALIGLALSAIGFALIGSSGRDDPAPSAERATAEPVPSGLSAVPDVKDAPVDERARGRPIGLEIPAIGVSAHVVPVATVAGVLTPPDDVRVIGWWDGGALVGDEQGTVLLAGHTFSGGDGVFDRLGDLAPGSRVTVATAHGSLVYRVESVVDYPRERIADLAPLLFATTARPQLVLTTCSGYDGEVYRMTTVVRALPLGGDEEPDSVAD